MLSNEWKTVREYLYPIPFGESKALTGKSTFVIDFPIIISVYRGFGWIALYFSIIVPLKCPCLANLPAVFDHTRVTRATLGRRYVVVSQVEEGDPATVLPAHPLESSKSPRVSLISAECDLIPIGQGGRVWGQCWTMGPGDFPMISTEAPKIYMEYGMWE